MPELPEVETVRQMLIKSLPKTSILDIEVFYTKILQNVSVEEFRKRLIGAKLEDVGRLGKYLIFVFDKAYLISHLRMEGKYNFEKEFTRTKHDHILFYWQEGILSYNDTRKFGTMHLFSKTEDIKNIYPLNKLGPEVASKNLDKDYLYSKLKKKNVAIKTALLDQSVISGLGNIYVDEVLFRSRISPLKLASSLSLEDVQTIICEAKVTIDKAIKLGGTTIRTFSSGSIHGLFQNELLIHQQDHCSVCNKKVEKIFIGGRGTYHCSNCQNL